MQIGALEIELFSNIARLQRDMSRATQVVDRATSGMARAAEMAKTALAGIAGGFSLGAIVNQLVSAQREFDKLNSSLITATGSVQGASAAYKSLQAFAATTPYSVAEATEAFIKMKNLGLDPSERALRSYGNTASAMGKGLDQMIEAVADAATGEFERLKEFGIKASQENGKVALTFRGVTTSIGNNATEIQAYLKRIGEVEFAGAMERRAKTLDGAISGLGDSWDSFVLKFAQSGFGDAAQDGVRKLSDLLERLGDRVDSVADGMITAAKIGGAYVGAFILAPALFQATATALGNLNLQIALARMEMAAGTPIAGLFATSVERVGVAALWSSGMLGKLKIAAGLLFAGFTGWEIGKYLEDQFVEVKVFAEVLTGAVLEMWEHIKLAFRLGLDAVTVIWRAEFSAMATFLSKVYGGIATGLEKIGFTEKGAQVQEFADRVKKAAESQGTFASRTAEARAEHERNIKAIRQVTDSHVAAIIVADQVSEATRGTAAAAAAAGKAAGEMSKEQKKAFEAGMNFIEGQQKEFEAIGKNADQLRMLAAARAAAAAPLENQRKAIMAYALAITIATKAWEENEATRKAVEDTATENSRTLLQLQQRARGLEQEIELHGKTAEAAVYAEAAKVRATAGSLAISEEYRAELVKQAEELDRIAGLTKRKMELDEEKKLNDERLAAQKQLWGDIERTAHDTFISIFDSGKSAFDRLKDALKNGLYELLYQMTVKKWVINLQASSTGGSLAQAITSSGSGGSSIFGTASNLFEVGKSIFGGFKTGLSSYLGQGVSYVGNAVGSNAMFSFGQGMQGFGAGGIGSGISGGAASAGSSFASALPIAGWIAAGMMANNKFYDQGWRMDGQSSDIIKSQFDSMWKGNGLAPLTTIMTASMGTFDKLLTSLGLDGKTASMLSGSALWTRAFGRKAPSIEAQGIQGTVSSSGFDGQAYAEMLEKGGWFRSDKRYTQTAALGADQDKSLDATVKAMIDAAKGFASTLGIEAGVIEGYNKQIKLELGKDEAKNQEAIAKLFGEIGDELSLRLVPGLSSFALAGETTSATLQRLVTNYATVDEALTAIGMQFGAVGVQSLEARERLLSAAGGLEAFAANTAGFQQNFLTEAERNAPVLKAVTEQLTALGLAGVDTRDEFKQVVLGLDLTTEAGAKQYGELMKMQAAFAQVYPAIDAAAIAAEREAKVLQERAGLQERLDALTLTSAELREKEIAKYDESNHALLRQIFALEDQKAALQASADALDALKQAANVLLGDVDGALSAMQSVAAREKEAVQSSIDAHTASVAKLQSLSQSLRATLDGIRSPDQQLAARAVGQAQISAALAIARAGGPLPNADSLKDALAAVKQDASGQFSNYTDYLRDLYKTQNDIGALADLTDVSLSVEEKALKAAQDQVKSLDEMLKAAQSQVDLLKGINTNGLNMIQAMEALRGAILAAQANPVAAATSAINGAYQTYLGRAPEAGGKEFWQNRAAEGVPIDVITDAIKNSPEAQLQNVYKDLLGRTADAGGLSFYLNSGLSIPDIAAAIKTSDEYKAKIPGFANGGDFAGGVRLVGEVGPEIEVTGASRIHSTRSLMDALRNPTDNSEVLAKAVDRLTATVERQQGMIEQQGAALTQIQRNTLRSANTLDMVSDGGNAVRTKGATTQ